MPKQEHGQVVETAIQARGARTHGAQRGAGLESWPGRGSLRGGLFPVFQNLTSLIASAGQRRVDGLGHDRSRSTGAFRAKYVPKRVIAAQTAYQRCVRHRTYGDMVGDV